MRTSEVREQERLAALERYAVVGELPEAAFDRLTGLAARLFHAPIALISLVGAREIAFKSCFGLDLRRTDRSLGFCTYALHSDEVMMVPDTTRDPRFATHPMVVWEPHIRFYAGAPLRTPDGHTLGTLCILDHHPREPLSGEERAALTDLAALVIDELELRLRTREAAHEAQVRRVQAQELQDALGLSQLLQGVSDLTDLDLPPGELLPHVIELTGAALDVDWGGLVTLRGEEATSRSVWHSAAGVDFARSADRTLRRGDGGLLWEAAGRDTPLFVSDYARAPGGRADLAAAGVRAAVSVCLGRDGPETYVMTLMRLHRDRPWTARDRQLVNAVSRAVRQSLARATQRAELRTSEERLRRALEAAPVILWTADMAGTLTLSLGRALESLGSAPGRAVGRPLREVYGGNAAILANLDRALAGESFSAPVTVGERVIEASYAPLRDAGGRQIGVIGTGYDVTATVRAQREAVRARTQAETLLELSHLLDAQANVSDLAHTALAAVGRALGDGALVLWRREDGGLRALATGGEFPPGLEAALAAEGAAERRLPPAVLAGQAVFLAPGEVPGDLTPEGVRGLALLPVALDVPERAWVLGVFRGGDFGGWTAFERGLLAAAARTLSAGVERHRHLRSLETAARTDTLTGLGNRRAFELDLAAELSRARRRGGEVGLLSIDLDGLKRVNDTQGHARGDALLREFARALRQCLREEDRIHRLGGDEYVVVLSGVGPAEAGIILERVRAAVEFTRAAGFAEVGASAGLASFPADAGDAAELIRLSDARMYEAKAARHAARDGEPEPTARP